MYLTVNNKYGVNRSKYYLTRSRYERSTMATAAVPAQALADSAPGPIYVDTQHEDLVHDAQMDYYGAKLATCSSGK